MNNISVLILLLLIGCGPSYYLSPNGDVIAQEHQVVAILKPSVNIQTRKQDDAQINAKVESEKASAYEFQEKIYNWMLKRKAQELFGVDIQDISKTNSIYKKKFKDEKAADISTEDLCNELGVDGVIITNFTLSKPMSEGAAIALGIFTVLFTNIFDGGATNEVTASMSIKDCNNTSLIWKYDRTFSGSLGSTSSRLVNSLMNRATHNMPYNVERKK